MMRPFLTLLVLVPLTGCAALLIEPEDSTARKVAKVTARIPLALVSGGSSEIVYHCARQLAAPPAKWGAYQGVTYAASNSESARRGLSKSRRLLWMRGLA